jgi:CRISPR-associated protein Cas1
LSALYIDRKDLTLGLEGGRMRLRLNGVAVRDVPLALLDRVVIHARTILDTAVLGALAESGIAVLILSPRQGRRVAIVLGRPHNDLRVRLAQFQRVTDRDWCGAWSARLVAGKLRGQRRVLLDALERRPDQRRVVLNGAERLERLGQAARELRDPDTLRGLEGAGAAAYFEALPSVFPPSLGFTGRNRRPPRDPVNACLSLTYTLLHFEGVRAAYGAGMDPYIGFFHRPAFGRESMASDLLEPLRPHADRWVWTLFRERELREHHFVRDKGACLLNKEGRGRFYPAYERFSGPCRRALRRTSLRLANALRAAAPVEVLDDPEQESPLS